MKTKRIIIFLAILALSLLCLVSCADNVEELPTDTKIYHTVTFNFNNGDEIYSIQVEDGKTTTPPISPERENYIFNGWKAAGKYWDFSVQRIFSDTAFVAQWIDASSIFSYVPNEDGTITVTAYNGNLAEIRIPEKISGMTVSGIGDGVFEDFYDETAKIISLPQTVTHVGNDAFKNCIEPITILGTLSSIGESAFEGCTAINKITLSDGLDKIPFKAFDGAYSLSTITIPKSVTSISEDAFRGCTSLQSIILEAPELTVGNSAFSGCTALVTVFFTGSEQEWSQILDKIDNGGNGNDALINAKVYYYSQNDPTESGDFWYFNDKNEPRCW